jgi:biotin synthase
MKIRVAFGTGVVLGLWDGRLEVAPTTAHLLTYHAGRCRANCKFCPQASRSLADPRMLSRVLWPARDFSQVLMRLKERADSFDRVCVQSVNYPGVVEDLCRIVSELARAADLPISVSVRPLTRQEMRELRRAGAERLCFPLDACTPELFRELKQGYSWEHHLDTLERACREFPGSVTTHLIIGLGETEADAVRLLQWLCDRGITVGLFAFTPIPGTQLENRPRPDLLAYRRVQLAHFLIRKRLTTADRMRFESGRIADFGVEERVLIEAVRSGEPFRTSGCPGCNRPFYNESPRGPLYNFPRKPTRREIDEIERALV